VSGFGGFWGRSIFSTICHIRLPTCSSNKQQYIEASIRDQIVFMKNDFTLTYSHWQLQWHRILREFSKLSSWYQAILLGFIIIVIYYVLLIVNPMGRILVRWKCCRDNLMIWATLSAISCTSCMTLIAPCRWRRSWIGEYDCLSALYICIYVYINIHMLYILHTYMYMCVFYVYMYIYI